MRKKEGKGSKGQGKGKGKKAKKEQGRWQDSEEVVASEARRSQGSEKVDRQDAIEPEVLFKEE
eukprot:3413114-Pyramimonas_sp.AAC.1